MVGALDSAPFHFSKAVVSVEILADSSGWMG